MADPTAQDWNNDRKVAKADQCPLHYRAGATLGWRQSHEPYSGGSVHAGRRCDRPTRACSWPRTSLGAFFAPSFAHVSLEQVQQPSVNRCWQAPRTRMPPAEIRNPQVFSSTYRCSALECVERHPLRRNPMARPSSGARSEPERFARPAKMTVALHVNGVERKLTIAPWTTLLD